jgi:hypothetical protein
MTAVGRVRVQQQKYADAASMLAGALRSYEKVRPGHWDRFNCQALLGASLAGQRNHPEAERLLVSGYEGMLAQKATMPPDGQTELDFAGARIVELYRAWNKEDKAGEWAGRVQTSRPVTAPR